MINQDISVVINYSTNDHKFLYPCLEECLKFSDDIVVSYTTHMYNGDLENLSLVENAQMKFMNDPVKFKPYTYDHEVTKEKGTRFWHNYARYSGWQNLNGEDYVLFLDVDEIPDGNRVNDWIRKKLDKDYYYFMAYWYFRKPIYQAKTVEVTSLMFNNDILYRDIFFSNKEREGMTFDNDGENRVFGEDGEPLFHHYSWVRTKDEMIKKVQSWGHNKDRDWEKLIEQEFTHTFNGTDFVHGYSYNILDKPFKNV